MEIDADTWERMAAAYFGDGVRSWPSADVAALSRVATPAQVNHFGDVLRVLDLAADEVFRDRTLDEGATRFEVAVRLHCPHFTERTVRLFVDGYAYSYR